MSGVPDLTLQQVELADLNDKLAFIARRIQNLSVTGALGTSAVSGLYVLTTQLSPASVGANTTAEQTFTVSGLPSGSTILAVNKPTAQAGIGIVGYRCSANNQLAITFSNNTAGGITPTASETYKVIAAVSA